MWRAGCPFHGFFEQRIDPPTHKLAQVLKYQYYGKPVWGLPKKEFSPADLIF
jgi:hypothetical protein